MDRVLGHLKWTMALVYLDDVIVYGSTFDEHLQRLTSVLDALSSANLRLKPEKCYFGYKEVTYLGHVVSKRGITPDPVKLQAFAEYPVPTSLKEVKSFQGFASYFRRFISDYARRAAPMTRLLRKNVPWRWTAEEQASFEDLKSALLSAPILAHFDPAKATYLHTDASGEGLGAVLLQQDGDDTQRVVSYASRRLTDAEQRYHSSELECLALVWSVQHFRPYLYGRHFTVVTDNSALTWLQSKKDLTAKLARWSILLQEHNFTIVHRSGKEHQDADFLSRHPMKNMPDSPDHDACFCASTFNLNAGQEQDCEIQDIVSRLQTTDVPPTTNRLRKAYQVRAGLLCHRSSSTKHWVPVVPSSLRGAVLHLCHDDPTAGHLGRDKTFQKILERYWWSGLRKDVASYVASCSQCQQRKSPNTSKPCELHPIPPPEAPFEVWGIDHLGPFPRTSDGNRYILVAVDHLTKWVELCPVASTSTEEVVRFLRTQLLLRHGVPRMIITDRGTAFTSAVFSEELASQGITHAKAAPYRPQTNGLVERANRTIAGILYSYVNVKHTDWDTFVPFAAFAMNTVKQSSTTYTPFQLVHGRTAVLPQECSSSVAWRNRGDDFADNNFQHRLDDARKRARMAILHSQQRAASRYSAPGSTPCLSPGDLVLVRREQRKKGRAQKLLPKYRGPCEVTKKIGPLTYEVRDWGTSRKTKTFSAHVHHLKMYIPRTSVLPSSPGQ